MGEDRRHAGEMATLRIAARGDGNLCKAAARAWGKTEWVLTAWCESREDFRNFRLDRISLDMTDVGFRRERGKEFSDYLRSPLSAPSSNPDANDA